MTQYGNIELFIDTRAAADIWIELHKTIRESEKLPKWVHPLEQEPGPSTEDPLSVDERQLYNALTRRFIEGLNP